LLASLCAILAIFMTVAFFDYDPSQYPGNHSGGATVVEHGAVATKSMQAVSRNLVGYFGVYSTYWSYALFGGGAWLIPVFLSWLSYLGLRATRRFAVTRVMVMLLCTTTLAGLFAWQSTFLMNQRWFPHGPGGVIGALVYVDCLKGVFGVFGSALLLWAAYALGLLFVFTRDVGAEFDRLLHWVHTWKERREARLIQRESERRLLREAEAKKRMAAQAAVPARKDPIPAAMQAPNKLALAKPTAAPSQGPEKSTRAAAEPAPAPAVKPAPAEPVAPATAVAKPAPASKPAEPKPQPTPPPAPKVVVSTPATSTKSLEAEAAGKIALHIVKPEELKKAKAAVPASADDHYQFPPLSLLKEQVAPSPENSEEEHQRNAESLLRILHEFGVEVSLGEIHVGPVITRYEVAPAPGVRVEKIAGLDKNIALGMRAQSVRILAPIPGKAAVGVEVPNQHPTPVGMREIIESEDWVNAKAEIPIALGKDVSGKPLISDLAKMPHLLIAGATGSGKSVCINSIIASILYSKSPKDLRLLMVDPKVVELKIFNPLPHMLIPVVTEPKKVPGALKWLLNEMEQRYQIFAKCNVRNIAGFNNRKREPDGEVPPAPEQPTLDGLDDGIEIPDRLPYIVAIIDELADLMMVAPAEIETSIARLAQLARAAGIHLIIATQRPSVNVITGVIKANLPSRIAFQVASQVDSRTILDTKGADMLIGRGDMLFSPPGSSRLVRAQGAFVSDDEVSAMVEYLKRNGPPVYKQDVQAQIDRAARDDEDDEDGDDEDLGDDDQLYRQALDVLKSTRRASTSMLQRRLRIGYNRAARIMEIMEDKGIVGPENGSSPREILVDLDTL
jgi:S-DNA-T family DNA segregation ATPase FtsK/SpoIIIE